MDQDDIDRELFELAREWMEVSKLKKLPGHVAKETDVSLWKHVIGPRRRAQSVSGLFDAL